MFILGFAIFLVFIGLVITILGGNVNDFLNLPSLLIILVPLAAVLTATKSFKVFYGGLRAMILPKEPITEELRGQAASLFRLLSKVTALAAALGVLICLVNMLMCLDFSDPLAIYHLGANIAAALILLVYGVFLIAAVFEPVVFNLKKRYDKKHS